MIPLKEEASLLRNFLPWSFATLTLLSLNVLNQKSQGSFFYLQRVELSFQFETQMSSNNDVIDALNILARKESW